MSSWRAVIVLDDGVRGALACFEGVMESYPPQCGGDIPVIDGWDWSTIEHESAEGVRWGQYDLVGVWRDDVLELTEEPVVSRGY